MQSSPATHSDHVSPDTKHRKLGRRGFLTAALLGWGYWTCSESGSTNAASRKRTFQLPSIDTDALNQPAVFESRFIEHETPIGFAHCASICQSSSGQLWCAWYGGSREGARDVQVWLSGLVGKTSGSSSWSAPRPVMSRGIASEDAGQFVRKVGNSLIFCDSQDRLWMIYVSIAMGGWATSSLNATCSLDGGQSWLPSQRLWLSPALNVSDLVRCPPVMMSNGEVGIPIYHECLGIYPEMLWIDPHRQPNGAAIGYSKSRMCGGRDWLQPSVVPTASQTAIAYLRCMNSSCRVGYVQTQDAGQTWSEPRRLELPNPNSAVCGVRLANSAVLLALNHSTDRRDSIGLVYSQDGISNWKMVATLDRQPNEKFSYPSMIRGQDGKIHLVYSWQMQKIRHVCFNDSWVFEEMNRSTSIAGSSHLDAGNVQGLDAHGIKVQG